MRMAIAAGLLLATLASPALAQNPHDPPTLALARAGYGKIAVDVTTGATGAPAGFTVIWATMADFQANGGWLPEPTQTQIHCDFFGVPTLNTFDGAVTSFNELGPNETVRIEIGDLFDETGMTVTDDRELMPDTMYMFAAWTNAGGGFDQSMRSANLPTPTLGGQNCTLTQGYWKNHPGVWPVLSLQLGNVVYNQAELLSILNTPAMGNGLIFLAHQLIAAELNIANGADGSAIATELADAHTLIGNLVIPPIGGDSLPPAVASPLTQVLDDFNNGIIGPGKCGTPTLDASWGQIKGSYRH